MPHRILGIICTSGGWGGLELNTLRLVGWLRDAGWKVHLLVAANKPLGEHAGDVPTSLQSFDDGRLPGKGGQLRIVHAWVRRYKIRVLLVPFNKDIAVASLYKRFYNRNIGFVYQQHMQVGVRKRDLIHTLRYGMIDVWISPLQYLKEETMRLTRVAEERIEVIPFGIDTDVFLKTKWTRETARISLSLPQGAQIIGVLGRLDPKKGQDLVVRAVSLLAQESASYHILLMGSSTVDEGDTFSKSLHELVRESGLSDRVHFRPYNEDVMLFFKAINVFAMSSHNETFGMVTLEAMAAGVPIVGTDIGGTRAILEEGRLGHLFKQEDVNGFCDAILALRNEDEIAAMVSRARSTALHSYSKDKMVTRICTVLEELINGVQ